VIVVVALQKLMVAFASKLYFSIGFRNLFTRAPLLRVVCACIGLCPVHVAFRFSAWL
jgi:hypothetical protein